jgi:hypothetical protein
MTYNREIVSINNDLSRAWQGIRSSMRKMHPTTIIQPGNATDVFRPEEAIGGSKFNVGPIVFGVPERAPEAPSFNTINNLFIAVEGWITFGSQPSVGELRVTEEFGTQVGYFRRTGDELSHVYGIHYDMDERLHGHPVFHAQMSPQVKFAPIVERYARLAVSDFEWERGLLRNVRTPTAQMDAFSVITQIGADHLMSQGSGTEVRSAFKTLRAACDFFLGAGARIAYLNGLPASHCYRSTHWYEREAVKGRH